MTFGQWDKNRSTARIPCSSSLRKMYSVKTNQPSAMKKALSITLMCSALFGALQLALAGTTNIYVEDWGTTNGATGANSLPTVGWTIVASLSGSGAYNGIYGQTGANDVTTGNPLPANTVYFTGLASGQSGIFYTTDGAGSGGNGDSAFTSIDPTHYTNLTFSIEVQNPNSAGATNYFAIQEGGIWYVSTNALVPRNGGGAGFLNASTPYTNTASAWNTLTLNASSVTIGSAPSGNLSGLISSVGIVETSTGSAFSGWNYNELVISAFSPTVVTNPLTPPSILSPPISQTAFAGGGASFSFLAGGSPPLTYYWFTNGVALSDGGRISGSSTNTLTITNLNAADALPTYSVIVSNGAGTITNSAFTLTVNSAPSSYLYAETFPYVGPAAIGNEPVSSVGWVSAIPDGLNRIFQNGNGGAGSVYAYEGTAMTTAFYTTTTNDTGISGLPFPTINPANYPFVSFEVELDANSVATDVTAYFAVQMNSNNWYAAAKAIPENITTTGIYETNDLQFDPAASNWNTLSITGGGTGAAIGAPAASALTGNITGAGLVFIHAGAGGDFNFNQFLVTTNPVTGTAPSIGLNGSPNSQSVFTGGGVSFGVSATGTAPFTYGWTMNGTPLVNGGRISGANTAVLTIANLNLNDSGASIIAYVTNAAGSDNSATYTTTTLTVSDPPVGLLYSETFPFTGPLAGNYPIGSVGWAEAVPNSPFTLYQNLGSDGAVFAYFGSAATTAYYTTTATDTNQAGLPFPNINLQSYPDLTLSVDIAPSSSPANVTAYFAVQLNGGTWYVAANPLPVPTSASGYFLHLHPGLRSHRGELEKSDHRRYERNHRCRHLLQFARRNDRRRRGVCDHGHWRRFQFS